MKITREIAINGQSMPMEFELTGIEMTRVYNEVEHEKAESDIYMFLKNSGYQKADDISQSLMDEAVQRYLGKREELEKDTRYMALDHVHDFYKEEFEEYKNNWKVFTFNLVQTKTHKYAIRAKDEEEAERLRDAWLERNDGVIEEDMEDEFGDYDVELFEEDDNWCDPDDCEIKEEE